MRAHRERWSKRCKLPKTLQIVYRVALVASVTNHAASLQSVDELLALELRTLKNLNEGCAERGLSTNVARWGRFAEVLFELASQLIQVYFFRYDRRHRALIPAESFSRNQVD